MILLNANTVLCQISILYTSELQKGISLLLPLLIIQKSYTFHVSLNYHPLQIPQRCFINIVTWLPLVLDQKGVVLHFTLLYCTVQYSWYTNKHQSIPNQYENQYQLIPINTSQYLSITTHTIPYEIICNHQPFVGAGPRHAYLLNYSFS